MPKFPHTSQQEQADCGPACLKMVLAYYGRVLALPKLREMCYIDREGVSMLGISDAAEALGLHTMAVKCSIDRLIEDAPLPFIAHWRQRHFVVVYEIVNDEFLILNWIKKILNIKKSFNIHKSTLKI